MIKVHCYNSGHWFIAIIKSFRRPKAPPLILPPWISPSNTKKAVISASKKLRFKIAFVSRDINYVYIEIYNII